MNRRDSCFMCGGRIWAQRLTTNTDHTGVGRIEPSHQLDQRGFSGAVFTDECVDFARTHLKRDLVERKHAWKGLGNTVGDKHDFVLFGFTRPSDFRCH